MNRIPSQAIAQKPLVMSRVENTLFHVSDYLLSAPERWENSVDRWFFKSSPKTQKGGIKKFIRSLGKQLLDFDYKENPNLFIPLPKKKASGWGFGKLHLGRIVMEPPMLAMVISLFGFTLLGRIKHAFDRAKEGDRREIRDIVIRDIPTLVLILYALRPIVNVVSKITEKVKGIQLLDGGKNALSYSDLENVSTVLHPKRLFALIGNTQNHPGMKTAMEQALNNKHLNNPEMKSLLGKFKDSILEAIQKKKNGRSIDASVNKAWETLQKLDVLHRAEVAKLGEKNGAKFVKKVPEFYKIFSNFAKQSRVWSNAFGFGFVFVVLGYGVTWFNKVYTDREFRRKQHTSVAVKPFPYAFKPQATHAASGFRVNTPVMGQPAMAANFQPRPWSPSGQSGMQRPFIPYRQA